MKNNLPNEKCDESCYYHCTKNGKQRPDCNMNLTLEHFATYLQYNVKVKIPHTKSICELVGINFSDKHIEVDYPRKKNGCSGESLSFKDGKNRGHDSYIENVRIFLRPLKDLTKEIEYNGEIFIPGLKLVDPENTEWDQMVCEHYNPFPNIPNHSKYIRVKHETLGEIISINPNNIGHLPYHTFPKLLEWHFDIFGLIEKGLAIDIKQIK